MLSSEHFLYLILSSNYLAHWKIKSKDIYQNGSAADAELFRNCSLKPTGKHGFL